MLMFPQGISVFALAKSRLGGLRDILTLRRKRLSQLRARWGAPGNKDGYLASRYFEIIRTGSLEAWVDDKTWNDLELKKIFERMDTTTTPIGSQVLFVQLRKYVEDPSLLAKRYETCAEFASNRTLREDLQMRLLKLEDGTNANLVELLFGDRLDKPVRQTMIWIWALVSATLLVFVAFFKIALWFWLAALLVNVVVIVRQSRRQEREAEAMRQCAVLLGEAEKLSAMHTRYPLQPQLARLHDEATQRAAMRKCMSLFIWYTWLRRVVPPPLSVIFPVLRFVFMAELLIYAGTVERFFQTRSKLRVTFELVGEIDAYIAMASFLQPQLHHCAPMIVNTRTLSIEDGLHPLLPMGVSNSIRLDCQSILVTGSNMAGKTTFIKMLAINTILGQTMGFCLASRAIIPRSIVMTSIRKTHSVEGGTSHYFTEIDAIKGFIRNEVCGRLKVLVIDEPFSGTNTVERIAVARGVLEVLGKHATVLVTTHDVELQVLLHDYYELYHFQEDPDIDGYFDYELKLGPSTERNAIRLLGRLGFPKDIIANAMAYAKQSNASYVTKPAASGRSGGR